MLQTMRNGVKGVVAYILVGLIIIIFALFGVESFFKTSSLQQNEVAEVNGKSITELDLRRAMEVRKQQLNRMLGGKADPRFLSDEFLRNPVLDALVQRRLLESAAEKSQLRVGDDLIDKQIVTDKNFQQQGKFDVTYYTQLLRSNGYTPASYREELKKEYLLRQFANSYQNSSFITEKEVQELARLQFEERSFDYLTLPLAKTLASTNTTDEEVAAYYEQHKDQFLSQELVSVEYLELRKSDLVSTVQVSDEDIQAQYNAEIQAAKDKVARHAAHILVEEKSDGSHQKTLSEIQQRLAKGEDFAALAKQYSADTASAQSGGDVGETTGESFDPAFEGALKKLAVGQVSEPIKTKFGYHLIKLLSQKEFKAESLQASRGRIEGELKSQQTKELYADKLAILHDASHGSSTLAELATQLSPDKPLVVQQRTLMTKNEAMMTFRSRAVVDAIFADKLQTGMLTDAIEINDADAMVLRLTDHRIPEIQPLDKVRQQAAAMLQREKASEALKIQAQALQARVAAGDSIEKIARAEKLDWKHVANKLRDDTQENTELLKKVFTMPAVKTGDKTTDTLVLTSGDVMLIQLTSTSSPTVESFTDIQKQKVAERLSSTTANREFMAIQTLQEENGSVTRKKLATSNPD